MNVTTSFGGGNAMSRQFTQQMQTSKILDLIKTEILPLENAQVVNPFFNNFVRIVSTMINQEPSLVNRFIKVEKEI